MVMLTIIFSVQITAFELDRSLYIVSYGMTARRLSLFAYGWKKRSQIMN